MGALPPNPRSIGKTERNVYHARRSTPEAVGLQTERNAPIGWPSYRRNEPVGGLTRIRKRAMLLPVTVLEQNSRRSPSSTQDCHNLYAWAGGAAGDLR